MIFHRTEVVGKMSNAAELLISRLKFAQIQDINFTQLNHIGFSFLFDFPKNVHIELEKLFRKCLKIICGEFEFNCFEH